MKRLMEDEIKNSILHNKNLFDRYGPVGDSLIIYEKTINWKTIADCLLFSSNKGIIGIEIKTEYDTLKRLPHQLADYIRVCKYTYVYCHDSHVKKVKELIKDNPELDCVGIISYEQFEEQAITGMIRRAKPSPKVTLRGTTSILWSSELNAILNAKTHTKEKRRRVDAENLFGEMFSKDNQQKVIAGLYIKGLLDSKKPLQRYHFGNIYTHDTTTGGDFHSKAEKRKWHQRSIINRRRVSKQ